MFEDHFVKRQLALLQLAINIFLIQQGFNPFLFQTMQIKKKPSEHQIVKEMVQNEESPISRNSQLLKIAKSNPKKKKTCSESSLPGCCSRKKGGCWETRAKNYAQVKIPHLNSTWSASVGE